jgi:hypothetical protein
MHPPNPCLGRVCKNLGTLDQGMDQHRKHTGILEWFRLLERKSQRPLVCCIAYENLEPGAKSFRMPVSCVLTCVLTLL